MASPNIKIVTALIKRGIFIRTAAIDGTVRIVRIPPLSTSKALQLQIWFGLHDDPGDQEQFEIFLMSVDFDNLPDVAAMRQDSEWQAMQHWSHVGTPANAVQTITHENLVFFSTGVANVEVATRTRDYGWALLLIGDNANSSIAANGTLTTQIDYIVRTWGGDNSTFDTVEETKDGLTDIDYDVWW